MQYLLPHLNYWIVKYPKLENFSADNKCLFLSSFMVLFLNVSLLCIFKLGMMNIFHTFLSLSFSFWRP